MDSPKGEVLLERLREYVQEQGGLPLCQACLLLTVQNPSCCCCTALSGMALPGKCGSLHVTVGTGSELAPGWRVEVKMRNSGTSAGTSDAVRSNCLAQMALSN